MLPSRRRQVQGTANFLTQSVGGEATVRGGVAAGPIKAEEPDGTGEDNSDVQDQIGVLLYEH